MNRGNGSDPEYEFYRKYHLPLREYINFLFPVALRLIGNRHDAEDLSIPVGTVARRLHDALKILRRRFSGGMESGHEH
jgi:DNA-directed RNA polymerase specialized sigma24 family protein